MCIRSPVSNHCWRRLSLVTGRPFPPRVVEPVPPLHPKSNFWKRHARLLLLVGVAVMAWSGCSRSHPTAAEVRAAWVARTHQVIEDPVRAQQIASLVGELLDAQEARAAALQAASERFAALNADYHATNEQLVAVYEEYAARQREALTLFRDDLFLLRRQMSASEWKRLID